jgi:phenylacetic acid degradation operon negative regulatory protein
VDAAALFAISENNVRVALVRLASEGLIEAAGRGEYRLAAPAEDLAREVASFRDAEGRLRRWEGGYVAVHTGALGRADRRALRRRTRALSMLGFAELERGLAVRPDNLRGGVDEIRSRLVALGLDATAAVFSAGSFDAEVEKRARALWDGGALSASYRKTRTEIERWLERAPRLPADSAARESFLLGGRAIRQIVYDPWLPPPLVDEDERHGFVQATLEMDRAGRKIWRAFFRAGSRGDASPTERRPH